MQVEIGDRGDVNNHLDLFLEHPAIGHTQAKPLLALSLLGLAKRLDYEITGNEYDLVLQLLVQEWS